MRSKLLRTTRLVWGVVFTFFDPTSLYYLHALSFVLLGPKVYTSIYILRCLIVMVYVEFQLQNLDYLSVIGAMFLKWTPEKSTEVVHELSDPFFRLQLYVGFMTFVYVPILVLGLILRRALTKLGLRWWYG